MKASHRVRRVPSCPSCSKLLPSGGPGTDPGRTRDGPGTDPGRTRDGPGTDPAAKAMMQQRVSVWGDATTYEPPLWAHSGRTLGALRSRGASAPEPADHPSDHGTTNGAEDEYRRVCLGDHRIRRAQQHAEREPDRPGREVKRLDLRRPDDRADHDADGQAVEECAQQRGAL